MAILIAFAFLSGIVTILSPCILPVLPVVLSGTTGGGKAKPYGILTGFVASFTAFTLTLSAIVKATGISADALRIVAVIIIALFGLVLAVPRLAVVFERIASRIARWGGKAGASAKADGSISGGFIAGLPVGLSLGLVWTPCVGPIMASVISLAVSQAVDGAAVFITLAYTAGTSIPMLAVMLGGRALLKRVPFLSKNSPGIQRVFGVLMLVTAVAIGFGWDRRFQAGVLDIFPNYGSGLTAVEENAAVREALDDRAASDGSESANRFGYENAPKKGKLDDFGAAPELVTDGEWFNIETSAIPAGMGDLRGKVVLVDFWTYSCVNCVRTIPYLKMWYQRYKDYGFEIIGVHTPEFEFEKNEKNVRKAISDLGITWPVVLDNSYRQWSAYNNRYWPAHYFIDVEGRVRYFHFGEGKYEISEGVIRDLLSENGTKIKGPRVSGRDPSDASLTPETYLGSTRSERFVSGTAPVIGSAAEYGPVMELENGEWNLEGVWTIKSQYVFPSEEGTLRLGFHAKEVFLVIDPGEYGGRVEVLVDGERAANTADVADGVLIPDASRLYHLVSLEKAEESTLTLIVSGKLQLYAFTFG